MSDLVRNPGCWFSRVKDTELRGCDGRGGGGGGGIKFLRQGFMSIR